MVFDVQALQEASVTLSKVLAPLGGICALWRGLMRHRSRRAAEHDQLLSQAAARFSGQAPVVQFFRDLQLQDAIRRATGLLVMPAELEAVFRFMREDPASLWLLHQAWQYRHRAADGRIKFSLSAAGQFWLWMGRIYLGLCSVAGGLFVLSAALTPVAALPLVFLNIGAALGMALCGLLSVYANRPEAAVQRINALRHRWHPAEEPDTKSPLPLPSTHQTDPSSVPPGK